MVNSTQIYKQIQPFISTRNVRQHRYSKNISKTSRRWQPKGRWNFGYTCNFVSLTKTSNGWEVWEGLPNILKNIYWPKSSLDSFLILYLRYKKPWLLACSEHHKKWFFRPEIGTFFYHKGLDSKCFWLLGPYRLLHNYSNSAPKQP